VRQHHRHRQTGWSTGLTRTGFERAFLEDFQDHLDVAKRFNVKNLVCVLGATQQDIPLAVQHAQVIAGLKKVGDIGSCPSCSQAGHDGLWMRPANGLGTQERFRDGLAGLGVL
jgi:hypothetical protein